MGFFVNDTPKQIPPPYDHQAHTTRFVNETGRCLVWNDPGTGKTRSLLDSVVHHLEHNGKKTLVLAPKSILEPAWAEDALKFTPDLKVSVAYAHNRAAAFKASADVYITNHDAVKWILDNKKLMADFDFLIGDESTAYKNRTSQRSKAALAIAKMMERITLMTGTPMPNGVQDVWHQALMVDGGERLGASFFRFRNVMQEPVQTGPRAEMVKWVDKEGAADAVADLLSDITIRYTLDECLDIPENHMYPVHFTLPKKLRTAYDELVRDAWVQLEDGEISAINAAALRTKLLQVASGAVYDSAGNYHLIDTARYDLVVDLIEQREQCVVGFMWAHQKEEMSKALKKAGIKFAVIDGTANQRKGIVPQIVKQFQNGDLKVILAHPQSAGHGLTLTKATTTIWTSPPPQNNAEHFIQFNRRIVRAGQTEKTETILVSGIDTVDALAYDSTQGKVAKQDDLLTLIEALRPQEEAA